MMPRNLITNCPHSLLSIICYNLVNVINIKYIITVDVHILIEGTPDKQNYKMKL